MATKNVRVVGYLPPRSLIVCEYMKEESLSESVAIVKIFKHFFDAV